MPTPKVIVRKKKSSVAPTPTISSQPPSKRPPAAVQPQQVEVRPLEVQPKASAPPPAPTPPAVPSPVAADTAAQIPPRPNRKQREALARRALLAVLQERWPQAFPWDFGQRKPLALGIHQAVAAHYPEIPMWRIKQAIALFQNGGNGTYWQAVVQGGARYDLDGQPKGEVTKAEHEHAKRNLGVIVARRKAKSLAEQHAATVPRCVEKGAASADTAGRHGQLRPQES